MKNKRKGFTLIELLVTIAIMAFVVIISFTIIKSAIDRSKTESNNVTISSIAKSALTYTEEFKTQDKYWFIDSNNTNIEYACTTVGMLINKGILNDSAIGATLEDKIVDKDTSVLVKRDKTTKVYTDEILFNQEVCGEDASIEVNFDLFGNKGNNDWYIEDVGVKINVTNASQVDKNYTTYTVVYPSEGSKTATTNSKSGDESDGTWSIRVGNEGKDLDFCVNLKNLKDKYQTFCLSDSNKKYSMDKTKPTIPDLKLNKDTNNYYVVSNGSTDNVTSQDKLKYYFSENDLSYIGSIDYKLDTSLRTKKELNVYVEDEAGNKSDKISKILNIIDSQTTNTTDVTRYICSFYDENYATDTEAKDNCYKTTYGDVSSKKIYTCSIKEKEYEDENTAKGDCYETTNGTITSNTTTSNISTTVGGSCTYDLVCTSGMWMSTGQSCTNNGCPSGYDKSSFSCGDYGGGGSCSKQGATSSHTASCTNYCSGQIETTTYYCSIPGVYVSGPNDNCSKTTYGDVTNFDRYYCSLDKENYSSYESASNSCFRVDEGTTSDKTMYYCSLTDKYYDSNNDAVNACTNYCSVGDYLSSGCYSLN